jgi:hypothetical protein
MTYEQYLNEACKVLGYDSYAHYCETEAVSFNKTRPAPVDEAWKWLFYKMREHPHYDFQNYVYPLIYGRFGVVFKFDNGIPFPERVEVHCLTQTIEYMRWLAYDIENTGTLDFGNMIIRYYKENNLWPTPERKHFREIDYTIATGCHISWTIERAEAGATPMLLLSPSIVMKF